MAGSFDDLSKALKKIITPDALEKQLHQESAFRRALAQRPWTIIPAQQPQMTGTKIVQVETPDGPRVYDYVAEIDHLHNGALSVTVLHKGNRTEEVFAPGQWTHVTVKDIALEQDDDTDDRDYDALDAAAQAIQYYSPKLNTKIFKIEEPE